MSHGTGTASSSKRHSAGDPPHDDPLHSDSSADPPYSAPSSSFDSSIPFNLPPRRSMKMLKDGSDFVWPEGAHSLFVRGLQAWKFMHIGSKRTRAPRGEGKTDFLVRYLESHGVERTKKQVASHLQVLRTEWRNSDNTVLLSLVDDTVPHTRSLSEPSLPPPSPSDNSSSASLASPNPVPDHGDDRAISTPSLPSPISALPPPPSSSSLYHPAHDLYSSPPHAYAETDSGNTFRSQIGVNISSWQSDTDWNAAASPEQEPYTQPTIHHPIPSYNPPSTFHNYDHTPRPIPPSALEPRGFSSEYYVVPERGATPSSSVAAPLPRISHPLTAVDTAGPSYSVFNSPPSYPIPQPTLQSHAAYGAAYGAGTYHSHYGSGAGSQAGAGIAPGSAAPYGDVVEPAFLPGAHVQQPPPPHPQWARPPATTQFSRPPSAPAAHDDSPPR